MQWLNSEEFWQQYNSGYFPAQQTLLTKKPFPEGTEGFQQQFTEGARSWGPYASGPAAIAVMWNDTSREFGAAFIGEKSSAEAAQSLLDSVQKQIDG
ncbi:MAG: hypothetical protein AAFY56_17350 [Pseudomonadota bacterium]